MKTKQKPLITVVLGTARKGRESEKIAKFVFKMLKKRKDIRVEFADVKEYIELRTIPPWEKNPKTLPWRRVVKRTDAFVIVTPEYNHGYPGELKLVLDQDLDGYVGKPVGLCGVSSGMLGGARVVEQLVQVVRELGLVVSHVSLYFPKVEKLNKKPTAEMEKNYEPRIKKMMDHLLLLIQK